MPAAVLPSVIPVSQSARSEGEEGKKGSRFSGKEAMRQRGSSVKGVRERPTATARQQQLGE
jgi:hypothetical protein